MIRDGRHVEAVTKDELGFALGVGSAAASGRTPQSGVGHLGFDVDDMEGGNRLTLTDIPTNRAAVAILEQFGSDRFKPIMFRIWALGEMMRDSRASPYIRNTEGDETTYDVHEAAVDVAASMALNKNGRFNAQKFFRRVAARARELEQEA